MDPRWSVPDPTGASRQSPSNIFTPNPDRLVRADETRADQRKGWVSWDSAPVLSEEDQLVVGDTLVAKKTGAQSQAAPYLFEPTQFRASADGNAAFVWKDIDSATYCCDMTNGQAHSSNHPRQASALVWAYDDLLIGVVGSGIVAFTPTSS